MGGEPLPEGSFLRRVEGIVGDRISSDPDVLRIYRRDYWPLALLREVRGEELPSPMAVVWPEDADEVAELIKLCNEFNVPFVPYAGGSGVTGGTICDGCLVIDVKRMNKVLLLSQEDSYVIVESGILLRKLEEFLNEKGLTLRHFPQSYPEAAVGGLIATLSIGQYSTKYGGIEDLVMDIEVVAPDGGLIPMRRNIVPRASTGPNLKLLLLGSEGQLGIITKAALKVFPIPPHEFKRSYAFKSFKDSLRAMREIMLSNLTPAVARAYDEEESTVRFNDGRNLLLLIFEEHSQHMLRAKVDEAEGVISRYGGESLGEERVERWLGKRFDVISELRKLVVPAGLWFDTIETAATWSRLEALYSSFKRRLKSMKGVHAVLAHASHFYTTGACIYFTLIYDAEESLYWSIWREAMRVILENGGTISHHHGIGLLRKEWLEDELGPSLHYSRRVKSALDPRGLSNPGKSLG
ncbi:MAG: FAD-binding oxidoreductase [Candidatus Korarchaeum sp.]